MNSEMEQDIPVSYTHLYQPYQALKLLFGALLGQQPDRDCYDTACPILNAETL